MERLTKWENGHAYYPRCFEQPCYGGGCKLKDCPFETAVCERLAAYEDTGLMPEEVLPKDKADEIALKLMRLADLESLCNYTRLRELAEADKEGRVLILPCKVGDTVYAADAAPVIPLRVKELAFYLKGEDGGDYERVSNIGKTVFLTREEAEKALQKMEGKG